MIEIRNDIEFSREDLIACVDREIKMRERVYPQQVQFGRLSREAASRELAMMKAVRAVIAQLPVVAPPQAALFDVGGGRR